MKLTKSETNNAIIAVLENVRKHPTADRLKLATVLGTQVIVGLESNNGDVVIYFDSNLCLSYEYASNNNLYSHPDLNKDTTKKGYFGNNGRVRAHKLRGEVSSGFVAPLESLSFAYDVDDMDLSVGDEFTAVNGVEICKKFVVNTPGIAGKAGKKKAGIKTKFFHKHWDTKQLMREKSSIPEDSVLYVEEKIHGMSGRTAHVICDTGKKWWQVWKERQIWKVVSGTRRMDDIEAHLNGVRREIEGKVASLLHKGEEIYYEIYGYDGAGQIQKGFTYGLQPGQYKAMLYRVTITTPDGYCIDIDRESVYRRADELGLEKPTLLAKIPEAFPFETKVEVAASYVTGQSVLDAGTLREGVVVWFKSHYGSWTCLKHKSEEFLMLESKQRDEEVGDVEDQL